jgi:DNA polymerase-3 subunit alpha
MARRLEVKRYMEERYGADQVCSVGTYTTLQVKAAVKDLCRLKGVPVAEVNSFTSKIDGVKDFDDLFRIACQKKDVANFINRNPEIIEMVGLIQGQPKAKSIHACAMMIYPDEKDMYHWNPIHRQGDMLISEWEGGELDTAGFLKEDILGILQLSKFGDILKLIKDDTGEEINLYELPLDDPKVYSYFQRGWNGDVFHFGAKGLTGYCKMLKPDNITELVNCIGLYRPGVMEGNFHNEYILRKKGEREVSFRKGAGEILQSSRYIMIWQEQTMKMFQVLGGFNLVDADGARRAIGKKNVEKLQPFRERFLKNYIENFGVDQKYAEETWKEIENMADYQFNKSHAVAYANTGYACQWLKVNYPLAFWSVAFSYADDDDFPVYLHEINEIGNIKVIPPDINESTDKIKTDFTDKSLVWSISSVKQVGEKAQAEIMKERSENGPYFGFDEFLDRHSQKGSAVNKSVIENLISCGAFDKLESISNVIDRIKLIKRYRTVNKVKIDKEKDVFELNPDKVKLEWWHNLRQKKLCGLAFFNYSKLYLDYFKEMIGDSEYPFKDFSEIVDDPLETKSYNLTAGGYVYEIAIKTGRKGDYAIITLEQNYQFRTVVFWSNEYESFENILKNCKDTILFMNGRTNWDERNQQMAIYANENTEVLILT